MSIKKPIEHITVPQVQNYPAANEGPAQRTYISSSPAQFIL